LGKVSDMARMPTEEASCELCAGPVHYTTVAAGWDFEYNTTHEEFLLVRCARCGLIYLKERPAPEAMQVIYPPSYYSYSESEAQNDLAGALRSKMESGKIKVYLRLLGQGRRSVFDIGSGDGRLLDIMASVCPKTWEFSGIEISEKAAAKACAKGYGIIAGDFETADMSGLVESFDLALMHQVIEHTRSPRKAIQKARALLKKGGVISVETPDTDSWDWMLFGKRYWGGYHIPRHFYLFNKNSLCRLLEEEGFELMS
jgi:SAM-dependent methyltransferase